MHLSTAFFGLIALAGSVAASNAACELGTHCGIKPLVLPPTSNIDARGLTAPNIVKDDRGLVIRVEKREVEKRDPSNAACELGTHCGIKPLVLPKVDLNARGLPPKIVKDERGLVVSVEKREVEKRDPSNAACELGTHCGIKPLVLPPKVGGEKREVEQREPVNARRRQVRPRRVEE